MDTDHLIIFDFDGVIVNTLEMSFAIHQMFVKDATLANYLEHFEGNIYEALKARRTSVAKSSDTGRSFAEEYAIRMGEHRPEEAMPEVIRVLGERYPLIIVSSSYSEQIKEFLTIHDLGQYFQAIMGADIHKNKAIKIRMALQGNNILSSNAIMITDTLGDMREADQCGVAAIGVTWGFHPEETLRKGNPFAIATHPKEIPDFINSYFSKK